MHFDGDPVSDHDIPPDPQAGILVKHDTPF